MEDTADLVRPLKGRKAVEKNHPLQFIGQSTRSNYCAVYSTGMLLSMLGMPITRPRLLRLFDLTRTNPRYLGASHADIGIVFAREVHLERWRWVCWPAFDFDAISESLRWQLRRTGCPTLLSFGIIHKNRRWRARHVAVVRAAADRVIELLDPLGRKPHINCSANVLLRLSPDSQNIRVIGNSYYLDTRQRVGVLCWSKKHHGTS
jgi:hypothetical protein